MTSVFRNSARARVLLLWLVLVACLPLAPACSPAAGRDVAADALDAVREAANSGDADVRDRPSSSEVRVTRAVDGDTLEISPDVAGRTDVRLIGVDTPESAIPGESPQPLGKDAAAFTSRNLEGRTVVLTFDEELVDPYDRLLAYARLPQADHTHNERLVRLGLAQVAIFEPNDALASELYAAQDAARTSGSGIWSLPARHQCRLADRGNGIGEGSVACWGPASPPAPSPAPPASAARAAPSRSSTPARSDRGPGVGSRTGVPDIERLAGIAAPRVRRRDPRFPDPPPLLARPSSRAPPSATQGR